MGHHLVLSTSKKNHVPHVRRAVLDLGISVNCHSENGSGDFKGRFFVGAMFTKRSSRWVIGLIINGLGRLNSQK